MQLDVRLPQQVAHPARVSWYRTVLATLLRHPRLAMALKASLAAGLSWLAVRPLDGVAEHYPYYAPLGAVVAVSTTVASSMRGATQTVTAILAGATAAMAFDAWVGANEFTVAAVVGLGTLIGGWRRLGQMGSWVPVSAIFVLIVGNADPEQYVLAYAGLIALGASIGVGVNLVFPPLPLNAAADSLERLRQTLAGQFDELAEALLAEQPLSMADWQRRAQVVESAANETRETVQRAAEAERANWRAARWRDQARRYHAAASTLEELPFIVTNLTATLLHESASGEDLPWGAPVRPRIAHALQAGADLLRSIDDAGGGPEELAALDEALDRLAEEVRTAREQHGADLFGVGSIISTLRRAQASVPRREA